MQKSAINPHDRNASATRRSRLFVSSSRLSQARSENRRFLPFKREKFEESSKEENLHFEHQGFKKLTDTKVKKRIKDNQRSKKDSKNQKQQEFKNFNV